MLPGLRHCVDVAFAIVPKDRVIRSRAVDDVSIDGAPVSKTLDAERPVLKGFQLLDGKSDILLKSVGVLLRPGSYEVAINDGRELDSYRYAISYADVR